jgi:hypothetical protein
MPRAGDRYYAMKPKEGNTFLVLYVGLWLQAPADIQALEIENGLNVTSYFPPHDVPIVLIKSSNGHSNYWYTLEYFLMGYKGLKAN